LRLVLKVGFPCSGDLMKVEQFIREFTKLLGGERYVQKDKQKGMQISRKVKGRA
jgi:hypothetical protein